MDKKLTSCSRLSTFQVNKRGATSKFDTNASLLARREKIFDLINKHIDIQEVMENEDVEFEHKFEEKFSHLLQLHRDKLRSVSNEEDQRKLVYDIKDRIKKTIEECNQERENNENIKVKIDRFNGILNEIKEPNKEEEEYKKKKDELNL
ncbi:hypothetical protein Mgra_00006353 [Meloidogyne graminicola]|uniref:Uncharacterized protein n=1 Tax=Meloidogyne graminicola TaxID=189291 RepID=A0A8S9ZLV9_9BILA|nr:hypothetical protein Mgra_00006353 [Meloidogyne graminicola]